MFLSKGELDGIGLFHHYLGNIKIRWNCCLKKDLAYDKALTFKKVRELIRPNMWMGNTILKETDLY